MTANQQEIFRARIFGKSLGSGRILIKDTFSSIFKSKKFYILFIGASVDFIQIYSTFSSSGCERNCYKYISEIN